MNTRFRWAVLAAAVLLAVSASAQAGDEPLADRYAGGVDFPQFLTTVERYADTWRGNAARAQVPAEVAATLAGLERSWRLLVITEDDCPDSANTVPYLARMAANSPGLELRVVLKQDAGDLLDNRPGYRGYGAIPTVIILDEQGRESGCWIEQPADQRAYHAAVLDGELSSRQRKKATRQYLDWYDQDAGSSTLREVADLLQAAEQGAQGCRLPVVDTEAAVPGREP